MNASRSPAGLYLSAIATLCALGGCGDVSVTGNFDGRELRVSGTAFAWIDETEYVQDSGGGTPVLVDKRSDATILHLRFTEAVFDPRVDLRALPAGERQAILDDIARGDQLLIDVRRGGSLRPGDDVRLIDPGALPPEVLPFISSVKVILGEPLLSEATRYPDRVQRLGSQLTVDLDVTETSPLLVGRVDLEAERGPAEGDGFLEGTIEVSFSTELIPERLAECNFAPFDQGIVDPCNPG
jgi:hypothetical protein